MNENGIEKKKARGFSRSKVRVSVKLFCGDDILPIESEAEDLSMNGVFMRTDSRVPKDHSCHIEIRMGDLVHVEATGTIARLSDNGIAIRFNEIIGEESYEHLEHLVLYNNADPEQVLAESKSHSGIRE